MDDLRKLQLEQLNMFKAVSKLLDNANIQYFAIGGTALGAIRHNGFIPWDDDIDIGLLRPDYEKLLTMQSQLPSNLKLLSHEIDPNFHLPFCKIYNMDIPYFSKGDKKYNTPMNVFLDFFPWDNIAEPQKLKIKLKKINKKFKRSIYRGNGSFIEQLKYFLYKPLYGFKNATYFFNLMRKETSSSYIDGSETWGHVLENDVLEYSDIFPLRKVKFEDIEINVPNNCEKYLTLKYGDYMTLPKEKDRINHSGIAPLNQIAQRLQDIPNRIIAILYFHMSKAISYLI